MPPGPTVVLKKRTIWSRMIEEGAEEPAVGEARRIQ